MVVIKQSKKLNNELVVKIKNHYVLIKCLLFIILYAYILFLYIINLYKIYQNFFKRVTIRQVLRSTNLWQVSIFFKSTNLLIENFHLIHIVKVLVCVNILYLLLLKMQQNTERRNMATAGKLYKHYNY